MDKIKRTSLFFRILFQILFVALPVILIVVWLKSGGTMEISQENINFNYIPELYSQHSHLPLTLMQKLLTLASSLLPTSAQLFTIFSLIQLFKLYERGVIFSTENVRYIRNIGYFLIVTQILKGLNQALMGIILTWNNPPGARFFSISMDQTNLSVIIVALMVILISWIMLEACKIREEQQLTV